MSTSDRQELAKLLREAKGRKLTAEEVQEQRESWVRGEMGIGNDADEARERAALRIDEENRK